MRFGFVLPGGSPREQVEQAVLAEDAGWDGIFVWEAAYGVDVRPVQRPRIPIWVVGAWRREKSMRRVLRCDGLLPVCMDATGFRPAEPDDIRAMVAWLDEHGGRRPGFDIVMEGETPGHDPEAAAVIVRPWAEAGCTWWLDARWKLPPGAKRAQKVRARLEAGPPRA